MSWSVVYYIFQVATGIGATIAAIVASRLWLKEQKRQSVAAAKDELVKISKDNAEAWKNRFEAEHLEYTNYRNEQHTRNNDVNATLLRLTEENTLLKAKTDLSPILSFQKEQTAVNEKVLEALDLILKHLRTLNGAKTKQKKVT